MRKQSISFAKVKKVFVKYQAQGGGLTPTPIPLRTPLYVSMTNSQRHKRMLIVIHFYPLRSIFCAMVGKLRLADIFFVCLF